MGSGCVQLAEISHPLRTAAARGQRSNAMVLQEGTTYTFSQIIDLNVEIDSFLADSGYRSRVAPLSLATKSNLCPLPQFDQLRAQMRGRLPHVPLTNDAARRAFYVSPLLFAALDQASFRMHIDYPVTGGRLSGRVDFLLRGAHDVVVTCATETDMARALTPIGRADDRVERAPSAATQPDSSAARPQS